MKFLAPPKLVEMWKNSFCGVIISARVNIKTRSIFIQKYSTTPPTSSLRYVVDVDRHYLYWHIDQKSKKKTSARYLYSSKCCLLDAFSTLFHISTISRARYICLPFSRRTLYNISVFNLKIKWNARVRFVESPSGKSSQRAPERQWKWKIQPRVVEVREAAARVVVSGVVSSAQTRKYKLYRLRNASPCRAQQQSFCLRCHAELRVASWREARARKLYGATTMKWIDSRLLISTLWCFIKSFVIFNFRL